MCGGGGGDSKGEWRGNFGEWINKGDQIGFDEL